MSAEAFRDMTLDQLDDQLQKLKKEQFNLRFQRATGQLENTSRVREVRRDVARLKTIAREKRGGRPATPASAPATEPAAKPQPRRASRARSTAGSYKPKRTSKSKS